MFARVSRYRHIATDDLDEQTELSEEKIVPQVKALPGFAGLQYLVDRETGDALSITYWETAEDLRNSEDEANRIRDESNELSGGETSVVERYEVMMQVDA